LRTKFRRSLSLVFGLGLSACGSSNRSPSAEAGISVPDGAVAGAEVASAIDAAGTVADRPANFVEVGQDTAVLPADVHVDTATPSDMAAPITDGPSASPDGIPAEAVVRVDASADAGQAEAAKPVDTAIADTASPKADLAPATLGELSPKQLHDMLATKDFKMIDVHYPNAGSIPGTDARIAYDDIPALVAFIGPDLDTKVVLTCLSGHMSKDAGDKLAARGYRNIYELTGGMNAWTSAGYSLVRLDGGL
jgi:phage shock protein E